MPNIWSSSQRVFVCSTSVFELRRFIKENASSLVCVSPFHNSAVSISAYSFAFRLFVSEKANHYLLRKFVSWNSSFEIIPPFIKSFLWRMCFVCSNKSLIAILLILPLKYFFKFYSILFYVWCFDPINIIWQDI